MRQFPESGSHCFTREQKQTRREIKSVRVKQRPPAELIWETMRRKGWAVIDLADHMEGDRLQNRSLLVDAVPRSRPAGPSWVRS